MWISLYVDRYPESYDRYYKGDFMVQDPSNECDSSETFFNPLIDTPKGPLRRTNHSQLFSNLQLTL